MREGGLARLGGALERGGLLPLAGVRALSAVREVTVHAFPVLGFSRGCDKVSIQRRAANYPSCNQSNPHDNPNLHVRLSAGGRAFLSRRGSCACLGR